MNPLLSLGFILLVFIAIWLAKRWLLQQGDVGLRRLRGYRRLRQQMGQAVESGSTIHISLGRGAVTSQKAATSFAALQLLDVLAEQSKRSGILPDVTVGDGTLLPTAESGLRKYAQLEQIQHSQDSTQFVADANEPIAFANGVINAIERKPTAGYIAAGHQNTEVALVGFTAQKNEIDQLVATDDPVGMAIATAVSDQQLLGEDIFAASAYLSQKKSAIASLLVQDIARWLIAAVILTLALIELFT